MEDGMTPEYTEDQYALFVESRTSGAGLYMDHLRLRLQELDAQMGEAPRLLMACIGLASEAGELLDLCKKIVFHGKAWNEANRAALIKELGDVEWYAQQVRMALQVTRQEVLADNVAKLSARYPDGFLPDGLVHREKPV
jgi:hypothetical protein